MSIFGNRCNTCSGRTACGRCATRSCRLGRCANEGAMTCDCGLLSNTVRTADGCGCNNGAGVLAVRGSGCGCNNGAGVLAARGGGCGCNNGAGVLAARGGGCGCCRCGCALGATGREAGCGNGVRVDSACCLQAIAEAVSEAAETGGDGCNCGVYGGMSCNTTQPVVFLTANAFEPIRFNSEMPSDGVAGFGNALTVATFGVYEVTYNLYAVANKQVEIAAAVRQNGAQIMTLRSVQTTQINDCCGTSYSARFSGTALVVLQSGDSLDLALAIVGTLPSGLTVVVGADASVVVHRVAGACCL